jgi:hypothetical protein
MTSSEPKTKKELAEEKLREINSRLTVVKRMIGSSPEDAKGRAERASKKLKDAKGEARFVKVGSCMVEGTDKLDALLAMEESYTDLLDLQGKEPVKEAEKLLRKKIEVKNTLLDLAF